MPRYEEDQVGKFQRRAKETLKLGQVLDSDVQKALQEAADGEGLPVPPRFTPSRDSLQRSAGKNRTPLSKRRGR